MQSNQLAAHDPAPRGNPERIPEIGKQADTAGFEDPSQHEDPFSPTRLPARACENAIRYRRYLDPDCW